MKTTIFSWLCLLLAGNKLLAHPPLIKNGSGRAHRSTFVSRTPPFVVSVNRKSPTGEHTQSATVTFQVTFSQKVRGVDASDFIVYTLDGNARGTLTKVAQEAASTSLPDAVKAVGPDSSAYDVTVRAIAGTGMLRLDVKDNNTGITDAGGNALAGGFTNGQTYVVNTSQGFNSFLDIDPVSISSATRETPQAKVWNHAGKWWAVLPTSGGTKVMRLDKTTWTDVLTITDAANTRADCRVAGNLVHILLFREITSASYFVSLEYDPALNTYKFWTQRTSNVSIQFEPGTVTATLAIDTTKRIWIASNSFGNMLVRWSDPPYSTFSSPINIESGATEKDICAVTALPGKIGVLWSNQNARRFGFKTHQDGANPTVWSADEMPAAQSALNVGDGMGDYQLNMVTAADGTLYSAVKTAYDKDGFPTIALLVRRPNNSWDHLYPVTSSKEGDRPFVVLNEATGKVKVFYTTHLDHFGGIRSGDILYRESSTSAISFGPPVTLINGHGSNSLIYTTSTHQPYDAAIVVLMTNESVSPMKAVGILATDGASLSQGNGNDSIQGKWLVRPNPFTNSTIVDFRPPQSGRYSITLYDSKGRKIRVLRQGWADAGRSTVVDVDGSWLANELYYIRIQVGGQTQTLKILKR
jgi:hypothetical protein